MTAAMLPPTWSPIPDKMEAVLDNPLILITDKKISNIQEILPFLEKVVQAAASSSSSPRTSKAKRLPHWLSTNCAAHLPALPSRRPGFGDRRKAMLQDIAILTGGQVITEEVGLDLKEATLDLLGNARQVKVAKDNTTIVEGAGTREDINARVSKIKAQIEETTSDYDKEKLQERLAKLAGGVAVIKVGAATETEMKEKKAAH